MLAKGLIHGLIVTHGLLSDKIQVKLGKHNIPFATITAIPGIENSVMVDTGATLSLGLDYLAWAGCRKVGIVQYEPHKTAIARSPHSVSEIADSRFLKVYQQLCSAADMRHGMQGALALLEQRPEIEALLIPDDVTARGACMAVLKKGRSVPEDLKMVCHWNRGSHFDYPFPVARLMTDPGEAVQRAMELLEAKLRGEDVPAPVLVRPKLVPPDMEI